MGKGEVITRTLTIGGFSKQELLSQLEAKNVRLNEFARVLFASELFVPIEVRRQLTTVEISVGALGFSRGATFPEIEMKAKSLGLELPPIELGPYFRIDYVAQEEGRLSYADPSRRAPPNSVSIASAPLSEDDSFPKGFYLRRIDGELWLRGYVSSLEHVWSSEDCLIFSKEEG